MLSSSFPEFYYTELENILRLTDANPREQLFQCKILWDELLKQATLAGSIHLQDPLARLIELQTRYRLTPEQREQTNRLRLFLHAVLHDPQLACSEENVRQVLHILVQVGQWLFTNLTPPNTLFLQIGDAVEEDLPRFTVKKTNFHQVYALSLVLDTISAVQTTEQELPYFEVTGISDLKGFSDLPDIRIRVTDIQNEQGETPYGGQFSHMHPMLERQQRVIFFYLHQPAEGENFFQTTQRSFFVIEPDNLISVTDISACVMMRGEFMPEIDLLKKTEPSDPGFNLVMGNMVNEVLDRRVRNPEEPLDHIFEEAVRHQALVLRILLHRDGKTAGQLKLELRDALALHESNIQSFVSDHQDYDATIEPTFYAPRFGLQGRADILMRSKHNEQDFRIYELKSGKAPPYPYVNHAHHAQVSCYEMIARTVISKNMAFSAVFYSSASAQQYPVRQIRSHAHTVQNIIRLRNHLVHIYARLARNDFSPFQELFALDDLALGKLFAPKRLQLQEALDKAQPEVRAYFEAFFAFVVREYRVSKLGGAEQVNDHGFSGLWRSTLRKKKEDFGILYGYSIRFQHPDTDLINGHFFLEPNEDNAITQANFRVGDIIVLYPYDPEQTEPTPTKNMVLKGYLKEMHENGVLISLRNKQVSDEFFVNHTHWAVEHDYMESGYLRLFESLACFLYAPDERKKRLMLGLERPQFKDEIFANPLELYAAQNHLFQQALNAQDYFLIQGPPGTGKTSTVLRSVAEYLYFQTDQNLLLLAFTNRAVDEIAQKLRDAKILYFRLGSGNDEKEDTLRSISVGKSFEELIQYYDGVRVFVSTVSSYLSNRAHLSHIFFQTAIIDEASQLLEPHLAGVLPYVGRFILIGDEKQLPAIVTQPKEEGCIIHPELQACGFKNLGNSLFERLLSVCQQKGWHDAYGMLTNHFRMHADIADFVSHQYYGGSLVATATRQTEYSSLYNADSADELEQILARNRLLFFDVKAEPLRSAKQSEAEARLLARIFEISMERLAEQDINFDPAEKIGIITPFRAQIAVIRRMLPPMFLHKNRQWNDLRQTVTIDTVERYQGSERDLILVSLVVKDAYLAGNLSSLMDDGITDRKLNVTLSRAKEQIILCGDAQTLLRLPSWKVFLDYCRERGGFVSAETTHELQGQLV